MQYRVVENRAITCDTNTIRFIRDDGEPFSFLAGQYLNVLFNGGNVPGGKAYSLSSAPHEESVHITVKNIGNYSGKLCALREGDVFEGSLPYGFFRPEFEHTSLVVLAGGIGITVLRSIITDALHKNTTRPITIIHSARYEKDLIFIDDFESFAGSCSYVSAKHFVTREQSYRGIQRRILPEDIPVMEDTEYLICGSIDFTRSLWRMVRALGVSPDAIYTEAFFSH